MRIRIVAVAMALCHVASAGASAQGTDPEHTPGTVKVVDGIANTPGLNAAQRAAAGATANRIIAVLRRNPALASPVGYSVTLRTGAYPRLPGDAPNVPYHTIVFVKSRYFAWFDNGRGGRSVDLDAVGLDWTIGVNTTGYPGEMENDAEESDHGPRIMGRDEGGHDIYQVTGTFRGHPVYGGTCTYLSHRSTPPVVPVTKERYLTVEMLKLRATQSRHEGQRVEMSGSSTNDRLKQFLAERPARQESNRKMIAAMKQSGVDTAQLRQMAATFDDMEKQQEAALRKSTSDGTDQRMQEIIQKARGGEADRIANAQAELDALSPAERRSPAGVVVHGRGEYSLALADDSTALPLMQPNSRFYDAALGADVPQVLWVCADHFQGLEDRSYERLAEGSDSWRQEKAFTERRIREVVRFRDQLDWSALDALIKP